MGCQMCVCVWWVHVCNCPMLLTAPKLPRHGFVEHTVLLHAILRVEFLVRKHPHGAEKRESHCAWLLRTRGLLVGCRRGGGGESVASYEYGRERYRGDGGELIEVVAVVDVRDGLGLAVSLAE